MRFQRVAVVVVLALAAQAAAPRPAGAGSSSGQTLVQLQTAARCGTAATRLVRAGAALVVPELDLYRLPSTAASRVLPDLRRSGAIRLAELDRPLGRLESHVAVDPLLPSEWWRAVIGVDGLVPPGPGRPVTIVDSGIDVGHPEFLGRANTLTMNPQEPLGFGGEHGTAVGSLVGAPANGLGTVGIYPEAVLRSWDAATGAGTRLETSQIARGILAAANAGPGVINLSLGGDGRDLVIEQAVYRALRKGSLVVAASGNDGDGRNPLGYPASVPHVLTVAATGRGDAVAAFSSRSRFVDLAAPGEEMPVATTIERGFRTASGTSFAAPLVSGAAAWVWTARPELDSTQLFEVMRRSARDVGAPGRDDATGFGILDVRSALAYPAPAPDPLEPNDDLDFLQLTGAYFTGVPPLTTQRQPSRSITARADAIEDPRDVYQVWIPRGATFRAEAQADTDVDLSLWRRSAFTVKAQRPGDDRLALGANRGPSEGLFFKNGAAGRIAYLAVTLRSRVREASYSLNVSTS